MRVAATFLVAALIAVIPAQAEIVNVEVTGSVEWNFARAYPLTEVNPGDSVTMTFQVDSDVFLDSTHFNVRGYEIDQSSWSMSFGTVTIGLADPYPAWQAPPYFVLRDNDPVADGFFVTAGHVDWPFPGLATEVYGFCGRFETHYDVSYVGDTLSSLDILDAAGTYTYDGLTRFYFNEVDCGFEVIGMILEQTKISRIPVEVPVDIKPGGCPNPVNLKARGSVPVAVLGTADLDVTTIDPASIRLNGVAPTHSSYEDVGTPFMPYMGKVDCDMDCNEMGGDGWMDLTLQFDAQELGATLHNSGEGACMTVILTGNFADEHGGRPIIGEDVVNVLDGRTRQPGTDEVSRDRMRRTTRRTSESTVNFQRRD